MKLFIREVRQRKDVTLNELSRRTRISKSYLSEIENGKRKNVSIVKLCKIAEALNIDVTELFNCKEDDDNGKGIHS